MLKTILTGNLNHKRLSLSKTSKGFTLIELLMAAAMTLLVVGVSFGALITIMRANKIAKATSDIQYDFNRAVEFLSDEIRGAKEINRDALTSTRLTAISPTFSQQTWKTPILAFKSDESATEYTIYYLIDRNSSGTTGKNWAGRYILYRWGPTYDGNGQFTNLTTPSSWDGNALVDMVLENWQTADINQGKRRCTNSSYTRYPVADATYTNLTETGDASIRGFFVCIPPATVGDFVEIHAYTQIEATGSKNAYLSKSKTYGIVTNAVVRASATTPSP